MKRGMHLFVAVVAMLLMAAGEAYGLTGAWRGELPVGQMKLPLVFSFTEDAAGQTHCTLASPSQGVEGLPCEVEMSPGNAVSLTCSAIGASYKGNITTGLIVGTFSQRGYSFPLVLSPESPVEDRRPQTPRPPFPYQTIDTTFTAPDGAVMAATLTLPASIAPGAKVPAVVMVTGSGPQNRDEEIFEHKPFAVIADCLARNGIASLRYDDRGTGKSTGDFRSATTTTFKDDALSGIRFLRGVAPVGKVGVLGHSEGGTIAFMIGAGGEADFVISLAGMAESGKETLMRQNRHGIASLPLPADAVESSLSLIDKLFDTIAGQARNGVSAPIDADSIARASGLHVPEEIMASIRATQQVRTPWFDAFVILDPADYLKQVRCPILAVNGEKDTQVHPDNLTVIQQLAPQAEVHLMPGLNHLLQHAVTGEVSEYGTIRETIAPEVLDAIVRFIRTGVHAGS